MSSPSNADVPLPAAPEEPSSMAWGTGTKTWMYLSYGLASLQGKRPALTDSLAAVPSFAAALSPPMGLDYFAVFDGHHGTAVAEYLKERLGAAIAKQIELELVTDTKNPWFLGNYEVAGWCYTTIQQAFCHVDDELIRGNAVGDGVALKVGATALVALVLENYMVFANCGFSKAVISRGGEAMVLTPDGEEDTTDLQEWAETTGVCMADAKLEKAVRTAHVFGSAMYKQVEMVPPEVISVERGLGDEFLILASDGLWESLTPAAASFFVRQRLLNTSHELDARGSPALLAKELAQHAISKGSKDNVSVVLILFWDFWCHSIEF